MTNTARSKAISGKAGGSYAYRVRGCVGSACGGWKASATVGVRPAQTTVSVPSGTINGNYSVHWTAPASATSYDVQERKDGGSWVTIASGTSATAIDRPGTISGHYTYRVSAKNAYGSRGWSATSAAVTVDTTYGVLPSVPPSLSVPGTSSSGSVTVSWSASTLVDSYTLQQSSNDGSTWSGVYTGSARSKTISGLANGRYVYRVQACNQYGCSGWKQSDPLVVTHPPSSAPDFPDPGSTDGNGSYIVSWGAVSTATSYTLQEHASGKSYHTIYSGSSRSRTISGKANGTYTYRVRACNAGGCGPWSAVHSMTVLHPPGTPPGISVPSSADESFTVSWYASSTASSYTLRQSINGASYTTAYTGSSRSRTINASRSGRYRYAVKACNAGGCSGYRYSDDFTVTLPPSSAPYFPDPGSYDHDGTYIVSWGAVGTATSYTLQEHASGQSYHTIYSGSRRSRTISGKANGVYTYRVRACNAGGCGPWSAVHNMVVRRPPATPGLTLTTSNPSWKPVVTASWNATATATSYDLEQKETRSGEVRTVYHGSSTHWSSLIHYDGQLGYRVRACNANGCSAWSSYRYVMLTSGGGPKYSAEPQSAHAGEASSPPPSTHQGGEP